MKYVLRHGYDNVVKNCYVRNSGFPSFRGPFCVIDHTRTKKNWSIAGSIRFSPRHNLPRIRNPGLSFISKKQLIVK